MAQGMAKGPLSIKWVGKGRQGRKGAAGQINTSAGKGHTEGAAKGSGSKESTQAIQSTNNNCLSEKAPWQGKGVGWEVTRNGARGRQGRVWGRQGSPHTQAQSQEGKVSARVRGQGLISCKAKEGQENGARHMATKSQVGASIIGRAGKGATEGRYRGWGQGHT